MNQPRSETIYEAAKDIYPQDVSLTDKFIDELVAEAMNMDFKPTHLGNGVYSDFKSERAYFLVKKIQEEKMKKAKGKKPPKKC